MQLKAQRDLSFASSQIHNLQQHFYRITVNKDEYLAFSWLQRGD